MSFKINIFGNTDVGRIRDHNEDSFKVYHHNKERWVEASALEKDLAETLGIIAVLADGMGGTNAGEIASETAVATVKKELNSLTSLFSDISEIKNFLISIVQKAHKNIVALAKKNKEMKGMGTTIVLAWIVGEYLYVVWSGDSRCYYYNKHRDKNLAPLTEDHSLVWTRVKDGEITPEEARLSGESNLILQSLGDNNQKPIPGFVWTKLEKNDRILICSDGLNSMLSDIGIQQILDFSDSTKDTCNSLINAANNAGGNDNITVIVIDINSSQSKSQKEIIANVKNKPALKKGMIYFFLTIILLGIIFYKNISDLYMDFSNRISNSAVEDSTYYTLDPNNNIEEVLQKPDFKNSREETKYITNSTHDSAKIKKNNQSRYQETEYRSDSAQIKLELTNALKIIEGIKLRIAQFEPEGNAYNEEFYKSNYTILDSITNSVDSLFDEINRIAKVNLNAVVELYDYESAKTICLPINETLVDLRNEIKTTTETK